MGSEYEITAIILAAGLSRRMGRFKPLLYTGKKTFLENLADRFREAGVNRILVVTGYKQAALMPLIKELGLEYAYNPLFREEMLWSVKCGVQALDADCQGFFIAPVDVPGVKTATLRQMLGTLEAHPGRIIYPVCNGRRGHPPLIAARFRAGLLEWKGNGGLQAFLREHDEQVLELPVEDSGILIDYDTPEDLINLETRHTL